jgi:hypothetical protein
MGGELGQKIRFLSKVAKKYRDPLSPMPIWQLSQRVVAAV